jgi:hypothetical protein
MNRIDKLVQTCVSACLIMGAHGALAQMPPAHAGASSAIAYPANGQTPKQQDRDKYECYDWARGQTGFDPAQPMPMSTGTQPAQSSNQGGAMMGGAVGGAAVAELTHHDAGRGAAIGALSAAIRGRAKQQQMAQANQQQAAQQQSVRNQQRGTYERAFGACMEARGYAVR